MEFKFRGANSTIRLLVEVLVWHSGEGRGGDPVENMHQRLVEALESVKSWRDHEERDET